MFLTTLQTLLQKIYPKANFWVNGSSLYFKDSVFVGHVKITECDKYAFIDSIYVKMVHQNQGNGTKVLGAIIAACRQTAFTHIECRPVQGGPLNGLQFFTKRGFTQRGISGIWSIVV
jgi:hypothetical protein